MATTTARAIRNTIASLIKGLAPAADAKLAFRLSLNQGAAAFRKECAQNPQASTRRVQVRARAAKPTSDVTNTDVEAVRVHFDIVVAYAQTHRFGGDAALDRDDVIEQDQAQIEHTVGRDGYQNIPNASWLSPEAPGSETDTTIERDDEAGVDFLVITQTMRFYRAR